MKKRIVSITICSMVLLFVFGIKAMLADSPEDRILAVVPTSHACIYNENSEADAWEMLQDWYELPDQFNLGSVLNYGDEVVLSETFTGLFDSYLGLVYFSGDISVLDVPCEDNYVISETDSTGIIANLNEQPKDEFTSQSTVTVGRTEGYTSWKVGCLVRKQWAMYIVLLPYENPVTPAEEPSVAECEMVREGNTTKWLNPEGKVVWTITEEADKIIADLSDWAALKADTVKAWAESGKALSITYKYNGYTVAINVPAGELTDTGAEWYGPEYLAAVNRKYVVVKDSTGLVVPNDRIYKK